MTLPTIDGRECVPVRFLPFMTYWKPLSPQVVAKLFSRRYKLQQWSISTFQLHPDGTHHVLQPRAWNDIDDELTAHDRRSKVGFDLQKWRQRSVEMLPVSVFVWRDELVAEYAHSFGRGERVNICPGAVANAEVENLRRLCGNPATADEAYAAMKRYMEEAERNGDGELTFTPLISEEDASVAFKGFESVLAVGHRFARADQAAQRVDDGNGEAGTAPSARPTKQERTAVAEVSAPAGTEIVEKLSGRLTATADIAVTLQTAGVITNASAAAGLAKAATEKRMPLPMKRKALIRAHVREWPTIARDLQDASGNKLSDAAKAGVRGWIEANALEWARASGKLRGDPIPSRPASVFFWAGKNAPD